MPRTYRQLDLAERRTIFRLLNTKMSVVRIARELGRHRCGSQPGRSTVGATSRFLTLR